MLLTPPPVDEEGWRTHCIRQYGVEASSAPNRDFDTTRRYAEACASVGAAMGVPVVDIHGAFTAKASWETLLKDGLHPSPAGSAVIAQTVLLAILKHYPELKPSTFAETTALPLDFPDHKLVDPDDPLSSFRRHAEGAS